MANRTLKHGRSGYHRGCRCDECRAGHRDYMRDYSRRRYAEGRPPGADGEFRCQMCGSAFVGKISRQPKYCTKRCSALIASRASAARAESLRDRLLIQREAAQRRTAVTRRAALAAAGSTSTTVKADIKCLVCGRRFIATWWGRSTNRACGDTCASLLRATRKREAKHRRRARQRGAYVESVYRHEIYARDKWTCGVCGRKVHRNRVTPHPMAPTIDHIIPLSQGGTHEPANVRTAHFLCNAIRGDRGGPEQLALIG
ncbi:HNH endonuclease [Gordonia sp. AC31]|uniref:HNH endonuclease n=1 Tax=Gordonia sp. AC31 TaxID=2962571 RepID=UPI0037C05ECE